MIMKQKHIVLDKTLKRLNQRWDIDLQDFRAYLEDEILIPSSIFSKSLSPLETVVKYLKENKRRSLKDIAKLLNRAKSNIYNTYKKAKNKPTIVMGPTDYFIPLSTYRDKKTVLKATVYYLKQQNLSFRQIGKLLQRNERTIWTVYTRN